MKPVNNPKTIVLIVLLAVAILALGDSGHTQNQDDCERGSNKTPPWFSRNCKNRLRTYVFTGGVGDHASKTVKCYLRIKACGSGYVVDRTEIIEEGQHCWNDRKFASPMVCCDAWREAVKNKQPCDPNEDADCDGIPNDKDDDPLDPSSRNCSPSKAEIQHAFDQAFQQLNIQTPPEYLRTEDDGHGLIQFDMGVGKENDLLPTSDWIDGQVRSGQLKPPFHNPPISILRGSIETHCDEGVRVNLRLDDVSTLEVREGSKGTSEKNVCPAGVDHAVAEALKKLKTTITSYRGVF